MQYLTRTFEVYPWGVIGKAFVGTKAVPVRFTETAMAPRFYMLTDFVEHHSHIVARSFKDVVPTEHDIHYHNIATYHSLFDYGWEGFLRNFVGNCHPYSMSKLVDPLVKAYLFAAKKKVFENEIFYFERTLAFGDAMAKALGSFMIECRNMAQESYDDILHSQAFVDLVNQFKLDYGGQDV